jgi:hypothetical protein
MVTLGLLLMFAAFIATCALVLLGGAISLLLTCGDVILAVLLIYWIVKYFRKKWNK